MLDVSQLRLVVVDVVVVSDFYEGGYDKDKVKMRSRVQYLFSKIMIWCDYIYM